MSRRIDPDIWTSASTRSKTMTLPSRRRHRRRRRSSKRRCARRQGEEAEGLRGTPSRVRWTTVLPWTITSKNWNSFSKLRFWFHFYFLNCVLPKKSRRFDMQIGKTPNLSLNVVNIKLFLGSRSWNDFLVTHSYCSQCGTQTHLNTWYLVVVVV